MAAIALSAVSAGALLYAKLRAIDVPSDEYAYQGIGSAPQGDADIQYHNLYGGADDMPIPLGRLRADTHSEEDAYHTWAASVRQKRANTASRGYDSQPWAAREFTPAWKRIHPDRRSRVDWRAVEQWENTKAATEREIADEETPNFTGTTAARTFRRQPIYISTVDPNRSRRLAGNSVVEKPIPY